MSEKTENERETFCKICSLIISLTNNDKHDLIQYLSSSKHLKRIQSTIGSKAFNTIFVTQNMKTYE